MKFSVKLCFVKQQKKCTEETLFIMKPSHDYAKFRQNLHWLNSEGPNTTVFTETPGLKIPVSDQKSHDYELENINCPPKSRNRETDHQGKLKIMELAMGRLKASLDSSSMPPRRLQDEMMILFNTYRMLS